MKDPNRLGANIPIPNPRIITTANPQLDQIMGGGIPQGSLLMLLGGPGTGKTTLALQLCFGWHRQPSPGSPAEEGNVLAEEAPAGKPQSQTDGPEIYNDTPKKHSTQTVTLNKISGAGNSVYFSLLSESHDKLISHASQFDFFDPLKLNSTVKFFSLGSQMGKGHEEVLGFIIKTIRQEKAGLVILDGFTALAELFANRSAIRSFLFSLSTQLNMLGATAIITIERLADSDILSDGDLTVADGVITFASRLEGAGEFFSMQVMKLRGMKRLLGLHSYSISHKGVEFYPRLEQLVKGGLTLAVSDPAVHENLTEKVEEQGEELTQTETDSSQTPFDGLPLDSFKQVRATFGLPELEEMLKGGLPEQSSTLVAGSVGVGKTLLGIHFLMQGVHAGEKSFYLGFYESNEALYRKARDFGMDLKEAHLNGMVELLSIPPVELEPDQVMQQVRQIIETKNIKRLVVDGFIELELACRSTSRSRNFTAAFEGYLKQHHVTVIYTHAISKVVGIDLDLSDTPFTRMAENLLLMRQGEYNNRLYRIISILKMRDSDYDRTIREFTVSDTKGILVLEAAQSLPGLLTGLTKTLDSNSE